jgi:hypothetical protein
MGAIQEVTCLVWCAPNVQVPDELEPVADAYVWNVMTNDKVHDVLGELKMDRVVKNR